MNNDFSISYDERKKIFTLQTVSSTYMMGLSDGYLGHIYYGKKIRHAGGAYLLREDDYSFLKGNPGDKCTFMDGYPFELGAAGIGDFRNPSLIIKNSDGFTGCELIYKSHEIYDGKRSLPDLPATFGDDTNTKSLDIALTDEVLHIDVVLSYSIFEGLDAITRSVRIENYGEKDIFLEKVSSASFELENRNYELISLHGSWAREHVMERRPIGQGRQIITSVRGISSHQDHPFIALVSPDTTETSGEVYSMNFVYSGNFEAATEITQHNAVRMQMGISPYNFEWTINPDETFTAPEAVMVYSCAGLGAMSRTYHDLYRGHLIRSKYLHEKRPVLINNWEATYFDFNTEKLLSIAEEASKAGIEMLVMDDGWFGKRNSDNSSLGDWIVNREKLPEGLDGLAKKVNEKGLKLGIWFEPEMISPDSDLYREHPDYAIAIPGRTAAECRNQYVLDLSRDEVVDYVYEAVAAVLRNANIEYVKWDMNRPLTDIGGTQIGSRQGELLHRYMLGVYRLQERLTVEFPDLLLENCSSGGARFDPGMLYYSPQIWCSDDTDAMERLAIQEGTSLIYPVSAIGAHVSDCPNHIVGRTTSFETRGYVALMGTFGYELDITRIPEADREMIPRQIENYHRFNHLMREGNYFRLASGADNHEYYAWECATKDGSEALVTHIQMRGSANRRSPRIFLQGLDPEGRYQLLDGTGREYYGDELMNAGFITDKIWGDGAGKLYYFARV